MTLDLPDKRLKTYLFLKAKQRYEFPISIMDKVNDFRIMMMFPVASVFRMEIKLFKIFIGLDWAEGV